MIALAWLMGLAALLGFAWWSLGTFVTASPRAVVGAIKLFGASFIAMASMGLLTFGRFGLILAFIGATVLTVTRLHAQSRPPDPLDSEAPGSAGESVVDTPWLSMRLDRASGTMSGRVRSGSFSGRDLGSLDFGELLSLRQEIAQAEPASLPLIDTWLDHAVPEWRQRQAGGDGHGPPAGSADQAMDEAMALEILGLQRGAERTEIEAAYRRVMAKVHPDRGGSDRLASLVNAARAFLLGRD